MFWAPNLWYFHPEKYGRNVLISQKGNNYNGKTNVDLAGQRKKDGYCLAGIRKHSLIILDSYLNMDVSPERYAPHLSEFYLLLNNKSSQRPHDSNAKTTKNDNEVSVRNLRRPSSINSGSSACSIMDLRTLVSRDDVMKTQKSVEALTAKFSNYSTKLNELAECATELAFQLDDVARLKGCSDLTADKFLNASGLFHLISNHDKIIANCCNNNIIPSLEETSELLGKKFKEEEMQFKRDFKEQSLKLKLQEKYNLNLAKRKIRNLVSYRENLSILQTQLDQLESLKHDYYQKSYELVDDTCQLAIRDVATIARAQIEISENIARKGWSEGGLDSLIAEADDPFSSNPKYPTTNEEVFSGPLYSPHVISQNATPTRISNVSSIDYKNDTLQENILKSPVILPNGIKCSSENEKSSRAKAQDSESQCPTELEVGKSTSDDIICNEENECAEHDTFDNSFSLPLTVSSRRDTDTNERKNYEDIKIMLNNTENLLIEDQSSVLTEHQS